MRLLLLFGLTCSVVAHAQEAIVVFAAASLNPALSEVSQQFEQEYGIKVKHAFAASSTLAKQIEQGAPADIFISADYFWMNYLLKQSPSVIANNKPLLGNQLALVSPKGKKIALQFTQDFAFAEQFSGKLCTGETDSVPVGIYAKQALIKLNWWSALSHRIVGTQDVRSALNFVERGECIGIVYQTDAMQSSKVDWIANFPEDSHEPIRYPVAYTNQQTATGYYLNFLYSEKAKAIFKRYGFKTF